MFAAARCEAKAGWNTFIKRRTAVSKINRLPEATEEQLERNNDVCAICYQDMTSAKVWKTEQTYIAVLQLLQGDSDGRQQSLVDMGVPG